MSEQRLPSGRLGPLWLLFSPFGRLSRQPYWLAFALVWALMGIPFSIWIRSIDWSADITELTIVDFVESNPLVPLLIFAVQWVELALVIKRLQDLNLPGLLGLLILLPIVNVLMVVVLGFIPSSKGPNRYGPRPNAKWIGPPRSGGANSPD